MADVGWLWIFCSSLASFRLLCKSIPVHVLPSLVSPDPNSSHYHLHFAIVCTQIENLLGLTYFTKACKGSPFPPFPLL